MLAVVVSVLLIKGITSQSVCQDGCCESDPRCTNFDFIMTACLDSEQSKICPVTCKTCSVSQTTTLPSTSLPPMTSSSPCHDTDPRCFEFDFIMSVCRDPTQATLCPQMCGLCSVATTPLPTAPFPTTTTTATTTTTGRVCEDTDPRCVEFEFLITACLDSEESKTCPKMCGLCSAEATTQAPTTTTILTTTEATTTTLAPTTTPACVDTDPRCVEFNFIITACVDPVQSKLCPRMCQLC
ncbi:mucin-2-like [Saccostrea echinata]|uniref:mucin-2-like n=1 Tax=Saccostrea echinata TaxID=191078 RepID=UPI002A83AA75|nr:mucin-2-like [Saccostrea echinata]